MHARHRSPGDGVRSNPIGIGLTSGRISPEDSIRGNGFYNSEYRNFNRGFGRGPPKLYPPPPPPPLPRKGDIIMEAGRLAAEYLVSQGVLPPNSLPGKWQNGNLNGQMGSFHEFRAQNRENPPVHSDGRTSALARLGSVVNDAGFSRKRFPDEFDRMGGKNYMRGKRRMGSFRGYGSDWGRESGRKSRAFPDTVDGEDDFGNLSYGEQQVGVGGGVPKVVSDEMESELENYDFPGDTGFNAGSSSTRKDLSPETDVDLNKGISDDTTNLILETGEVKEDIGDDETATEEFDGQRCSVEDDPLNKPGSDLLKLCNFVKVPTRARSSLPYKNSKVDDQGPTSEERNKSDVGPERESKGPMVDDTVEGSSIDSQLNQVTSDVSRIPSVKSIDEAGNLDSTFSMERERCTPAQSFLDSNSFMHQQESIQGPPGFGRSISLVRTRDESFAQHDDTMEGAKGPRELSSPGVSQADEFFRLQNLREEQSNPHVESLLPDAEMVDTVDTEFRESKVEFREEKQLLPSSFKICDLNLTEASEITESPGDLVVIDHISSCPSPLEAEKESSVDVGLSISNNCDTAGDFDECLRDDKEVEIIDVKNGSLTEDKAYNTTEQKTETIYSSLENFLNHTENTDDLPDVQDGYGLAISEFLGADIASCSSVPADIDLQTEMNLHNAEGIPGDDDSIYLSLGEIPISFLGVWDQPNQEYGKPL